MSRLYLVVARGLDVGARLHLADEEQIVGRARDGDLVLADRRVSRKHLQVRVHGSADEAYIQTCEGAAPFVLNGISCTEATLRLGDTLVIGESVLALARDEAVDAGTATDVEALMTGLAVDVRGLAAVFALVKALDDAPDLDALEQAVSIWAKVHAEDAEVDSFLGRHADDAHARIGAGNEIVVQSTSGDATLVTVPAHTDVPGWISFRLPLTETRVTDSLRRLLAVAGRICASRVVQLSALLHVKEERALFRRQALGSAEAFLGGSPAAQHVVKIIPRLAASSVHVLIQGETGSGKTFVARLVHESGPRAKEPLRIINCASIPENLIESELFGHERGSFTGAFTSRPGAFETAGRGTVLLDEIGELPPASQAKLLHVLEEKNFHRLGSNRQLAMEARIITATNRDLESMVAAKTFRADLFFRISVVKAWIPPLRERVEDLAVLAQRILEDLAPVAGRRVDGFEPDALALLRRYPWPGNVRELRNAIEHALVLGDGRLIEVTDFPAAVRCLPPAPADDGSSVVRLPAKLEWLEQKAIAEALRAADGNRTRAAVLLGIRPAVLYYKLRQSGALDGN